MRKISLSFLCHRATLDYLDYRRDILCWLHLKDHMEGHFPSAPHQRPTRLWRIHHYSSLGDFPALVFFNVRMISGKPRPQLTILCFRWYRFGWTGSQTYSSSDFYLFQQAMLLYFLRLRPFITFFRSEFVPDYHQCVYICIDRRRPFWPTSRKTLQNDKNHT